MRKADPFDESYKGHGVQWSLCLSVHSWGREGGRPEATKGSTTFHQFCRSASATEQCDPIQATTVIAAAIMTEHGHGNASDDAKHGDITTTKESSSTTDAVADDASLFYFDCLEGADLDDNNGSLNIDEDCNATNETATLLSQMVDERDDSDSISSQDSEEDSDSFSSNDEYDSESDDDSDGSDDDDSLEEEDSDDEDSRDQDSDDEDGSLMDESESKAQSILPQKRFVLVQLVVNLWLTLLASARALGSVLKASPPCPPNDNNTDTISPNTMSTWKQRKEAERLERVRKWQMLGEKNRKWVEARKKEEASFERHVAEFNRETEALLDDDDMSFHSTMDTLSDND